MIEYVSNASYWEFPDLRTEYDDRRSGKEKRWNALVSTLDTSILGLLGDGEIPDEEVENRLDEALRSSLWARSLAKRTDREQRILKLGFAGRVRVVFRGTTAAQRKAYFLAGVGLSTGRFLDASADRLRKLLVSANASIVGADAEDAIAPIGEFAKVIFEVRPFAPDPKPENWREVLVAWLKGEALGMAVNTEDRDVLRFVEDGLIYRLPWAMEAVRVHGVVDSSENAEGNEFSDLDLSFAVSAVETGTLSVPAAVLMKAGFGSRTGAIKAVAAGNADFESMRGLVIWTRSDLVVELGRDPAWPTPETHDLWETFVAGLGPARARAWKKSETSVPVDWSDSDSGRAGIPVRMLASGKRCEVLSSDFKPLGEVAMSLTEDLRGVLHASASDDGSMIELKYLGPDEPFSV